MTSGVAASRHVQPSTRMATGMSAGRVLVIHSQGADALGDEMVARLREGSYDAVRLPIERSLVSDILDGDPDVVVIRYLLGSYDLVRLCHDLRDAIDRRIIVVASGDPDDSFVVDVLDAGADDFVSSDVSAQVLAARLRVAVRTRPRRERPVQRVMLGDVQIDAEAHILVIDGVVVKCPPLQFQLLVTLARRAGTLVSRETLFRELWGIQPGAVDPRRLRIAISVLRRVLGSGPRRPLIESVPGFGYRLSATPSPAIPDGPARR
jgi:DNA-binding response OmpR family regulator